jgi:hypothetical protein
LAVRLEYIKLILKTLRSKFHWRFFHLNCIIYLSSILIQANPRGSRQRMWQKSYVNWTNIDSALFNAWAHKKHALRRNGWEEQMICCFPRAHTQKRNRDKLFWIYELLFFSFCSAIDQNQDIAHYKLHSQFWICELYFTLFKISIIDWTKGFHCDISMPVYNVLSSNSTPLLLCSVFFPFKD